MTQQKYPLNDGQALVHAPKIDMHPFYTIMGDDI